MLVDETNRYHEYCTRADIGVRPSPKMKSWTSIDVPEMFVFLGLMMLMPHVKKHVLQDYWIVDDMTTLPIFGKYMTRDRFAAILSCLHFHDNEDPSDIDVLWKVRTVFTMLRDKFKAFFRPFQKVVIDESLVLFRGRVSFRQYIPSKRHRFGIKFFVLCDCETGYVLDLIVYSATDVDIPKNDPHGFSGAVVKKLMDRYLGGNHILYTENYYTSPALSKYLLQHDTGSCGTVRGNRKNWPKFDDDTAVGTVTLKKHERLLAIRWHGN